MQDIDFVLAWVDGQDKKWREQKEKYLKSSGMDAVDDREERYRDWDNLRYWFRGVEKFAPWVHRIYFVTCGHLPLWLNTGNPKLMITCHKDYIPEKFLPTFNSNTIELCFNRIEGLSEQFVYFNDDCFIIDNLKPGDFFKNGKPVDMLALQPVVANAQNPVMSYIFLNNSLVLAKHFDKRSNVKKQPGSYFHPGYPPVYFFYNMLEMAFPRFTGFYTVHGPSPLLKSTYREIWDKEEETLSGTCSHRFRSKEDINQYLMREWQKLSGNFSPSNVKKLCRYFEAGKDNSLLYNTLRKRSCKMLCINDANEVVDFERTKQEILECFDSILPVKSSFEL